MSINGSLALEALGSLEFHSVLDIGSGNGDHAKVFRGMGKSVTTLDIKPPADLIGKYTHVNPGDYDLIWACHVLEHELNPQLFLEKCLIDLNKGGYLAITVPPMKNEVVGGHVSLWNAGILIYRLILAGFNCREAKVATYGYNVSVIIKADPIDLPELKMDFGDIETLSEYFPFPVKNGFNGVIERCNW